MPLKAYIDKEEVISVDQTDEQWGEIRKRIKSKESVLTLPCCKQEGFLRKSRNGLKHFVHSKSNKNCDWKPESPEHLRAKIEIMEACNQNGWRAIPEHIEGDWIADVLAIQNEKRIAFEVQWSKQTYEETRFRQERYKESDVRGCWFFRIPPVGMRDFHDEIIADKDIPAFKIFKNDDSEIFAQLRELKLPLKDFVNELLNGNLKFCDHLRPKNNQSLTLVFFETSCYKCKRIHHCYTVDEIQKSFCNQNVNIASMMEDLDKNPKVFEEVIKFTKTDKGRHLKIGKVKSRYSKTVGRRYLSHGCYHCDAISGDFFINTEKTHALYDSSNLKHSIQIDLGLLEKESKHWCYSEKGQFCE